MFKRGLITLLLTPFVALAGLLIGWKVAVAIFVAGVLLGFVFLYLAARNIGKSTEKAADKVGHGLEAGLKFADRIADTAFGDDKPGSSRVVRGKTVDPSSGDGASDSSAQRHHNEN